MLHIMIICLTYMQSLMASKYNQFNERSQHDAHEFMSFLLDGLHEVCDLSVYCVCVRACVRACESVCECECECVCVCVFMF